jgi:hypothetical protein
MVRAVAASGELKKYLEMEKSANRLPFDAQNSRDAGVIS